MKSMKHGYYSYLQPEMWQEALLCGNGKTGALIMGNPLEERVTFTHEKLFIPWEKILPPVGTGQYLDELRDIFRRGCYQEAAEYVVNLAEKEGYDNIGQRWTDPFFPACNLLINMKQEGEVRGYVRSLDFSSGLAQVEWQDNRGVFKREVFVSRKDNIAVVRLQLDNHQAFSCEVTLQQPVLEVPDSWNGRAHLEKGIKFAEVKADGAYLTYRCGFAHQSSGYECIAKVVTETGSVIDHENCIRIVDSNELIIYFSIQPLSDIISSNLISMKQELDAIQGTFDELLSSHTAIHGELFNRVAFWLSEEEDQDEPAEVMVERARNGELTDKYFEKIFDAGRYAIISSSGDWPPNLQGIWASDYGVPWSSDYTQNGNLQTAIAGMLTGNMAECMESFIRYSEFLMDDMRLNAMRLYNCRGILLGSRTSSHGVNNHFDLNWTMTFWVAGAGWAARFFYDYWLYTGDDDFLKEHALPYMKEVALFYEDYLIEDENGKWTFIPSYSPENKPQNSDSQAAVNATMDFAVAREVFNHLIEICVTHHIEEENVRKWQAMLAKLPDYQINEDGALKEWCHPDLEDRYDHRHASHLYPLFFGISREFARDPKLYNACRKAYEIRIQRRRGEGGIMAFGFIQLGMAAAHLGDNETVSYLLNTLAKGYYYRNFASSHDEGPQIFNTDISGGLPALIIEAIIQSDVIIDEDNRMVGYQLLLLPALPKQWPEGKLQGVRMRGGFTADISWDKGMLKQIEIRNQFRRPCTVIYQSRQLIFKDNTCILLQQEDFA